jgi:methanogenic corrinoid protein MtbC1
MTTTMAGMKLVIERLKEKGLRDKVKIIVEGALLSRTFTAKIGADAYSTTATEAPATASNLVTAAG